MVSVSEAEVVAALSTQHFHCTALFAALRMAAEQLRCCLFLSDDIVNDFSTVVVGWGRMFLAEKLFAERAIDWEKVQLFTIHVAALLS